MLYHATPAQKHARLTASAAFFTCVRTGNRTTASSSPCAAADGGGGGGRFGMRRGTPRGGRTLLLPLLSAEKHRLDANAVASVAPREQLRLTANCTENDMVFYLLFVPHVQRHGTYCC
jgi:hypothetical protein